MNQRDQVGSSNLLEGAAGSLHMATVTIKRDQVGSSNLLFIQIRRAVACNGSSYSWH